MHLHCPIPFPNFEHSQEQSSPPGIGHHPVELEDEQSREAEEDRMSGGGLRRLGDPPPRHGRPPAEHPDFDPRQNQRQRCFLSWHRRLPEIGDV